MRKHLQSCANRLFCRFGRLQHPGKRVQIPELNLLNFQGITDIRQSVAGYRAAFTWGEPKCPQLTVGTDLRYLQQELNELDNLFGLAPPCANMFNFPIPPSHQLDFGVFAEMVDPVDDDLLIKAGVRGDYILSEIDRVPFGFCDQMSMSGSMMNSMQSFFEPATNPMAVNAPFDRQEGLVLAYATAEAKLTPEWTAVAGVATAERPPTLTELYAIEPFLAVLQNGFTTVIGNPALAPEHLYQFDLGVRGDYGDIRAGLNGFAGWVNDYITYDPLAPTQAGLKIPGVPTGALTVRFTNTDWAVLTGFESYAETDLTDWLTPFATVSYVMGRDLTRASHFRHGGPNPLPNGTPPPAEEPLPGIPPLESRLGFRVHEPCQNPRYGVEFSARIDARQDQVAASLNELPSAGFVVYDLLSYWRVNEGILFTAGVYNLFDRNYREHLDLRTGIGVFQPGINPYVGLVS